MNIVYKIGFAVTIIGCTIAMFFGGNLEVMEIGCTISGIGITIVSIASLINLFKK